MGKVNFRVVLDAKWPAKRHTSSILYRTPSDTICDEFYHIFCGVICSVHTVLRLQISVNFMALKLMPLILCRFCRTATFIKSKLRLNLYRSTMHSRSSIVVEGDQKFIILSLKIYFCGVCSFLFSRLGIPCILRLNALDFYFQFPI